MVSTRTIRPVRTLVALVTAALAFPAAAGADELLFFKTPSRNVACLKGTVHQRAYLRCDILSGLRPRPARPRGCNLDWGFGYSLNATGRAFVTCAADSTNEPGARIIPYGATWKLGPFRCASRQTGLRCSNSSGHGFFLSRARSYRF
jgi:hypothetical protein